MTLSEQSPALPLSTPVDGVNVLGALSPSRAGDFMACPLLYRFRTIDKLPEPPAPEAVRGTVVHKVLEDLFDLPAAERTPGRARELLGPTWSDMVAAFPEVAEMFGDEGPDVAEWLASCGDVLDRYFTLEDPRRLEPAERELYVETVLDSKLLLRGFVDRVDIAPDGAIRVVDYKGLAVDTVLPTPTGWTTMGEVRVGDSLIGSDGRPTRVTLKSATHHRPCYRVNFLDGSSVVCDNVHLWTVTSSYRQRHSIETIDTDALFERHEQLVRQGRRQSLWVAAAAPVDLPNNRALPVDPYLLGAWLGDGTTSSGRLTVGHHDIADMLAILKERWPREISVTDGGSALTVNLSRLSDRCGYGHTEFLPPTKGHSTRRCAHEWKHHSLTRWNLSFTTELKRAGIRGNKHVPSAYLRAGREQRIDLLRGLMDTDGWWNKTRRRAGFTTTSDQLAANVMELLRTLGIHPSHFVKPYQNAVRPSRNWHVIEFTPYGFNPFSLPRKAATVAGAVTDLQLKLSRRRIISSIVRVPSTPTQCVAVDARDSLYLCGDGFVPTHNTSKSPGENFEAKALFQMKFYALVIWRTRGVVPAMLQLVYLGNSELLRYVPDERDLLATERKIEAIWQAIRLSDESGDWQPSPGWMCRMCAHQALCPAYGGTPPDLPARPEEAESATQT